MARIKSRGVVSYVLGFRDTGRNVDGSYQRGHVVALARRRQKKKQSSRRWTRSWTPRKNSQAKHFTAFEIQEETPEGKVKLVVAPETGIHSLNWAQNITSQGGLLSLPVEIRHRIYEEVLEEYPVIIRPQKCGEKFINVANTDITKQYAILSQVSRQTYVDVVGGGILYRLGKFYFSSPRLMYNYLPWINPSHKEKIQCVAVKVTAAGEELNIPMRVFTLLSELPSLQYLDLVWTTSTPMTNYSLYYVTNGLRSLSVRGSRKIRENKGWALLEGRLREFNLRYHSDGDFWHNAYVPEESKYDSDLIEVIQAVRARVLRK